MTRWQNRYDHRLRDLVRRTGDIAIATSLGVPRSTAAGWLRQKTDLVVSIELVNVEREHLEAEIAKLRKRVRRMAALLRLLLLVLRLSGTTLARARVPEGRSKAKLVDAITRCSKLLLVCPPARRDVGRAVPRLEARAGGVRAR